MTAFDRDTAVEALGEGRFAGRFSPAWRVVRGPNGGYAAAVLVQAILAAVDLAIDGGMLGGLPSTVVDIAAIDDGGGWEILRQGAMSEGDLASRLARVGLD